MRYIQQDLCAVDLNKGVAGDKNNLQKNCFGSE